MGQCDGLLKSRHRGDLCQQWIGDDKIIFTRFALKKFKLTVTASNWKAASISAVSSPFVQPSLGRLIVINELLFLGIQKLRWITDCFRLFMLQFTAFCYSFFFVYAALAACFFFLFSFFLPLHPISRLHVVLYSLLWVYVEHILSFPLIVTCVVAS